VLFETVLNLIFVNELQKRRKRVKPYQTLCLSLRNNFKIYAGMIINFSIQNFGSIKDRQTLSFEADKSTHLENYYVFQPVEGLRLLKLGLIYGANASGKTMILKALDFLRNIVISPKEQKNSVFNFKPFLFDADTPAQNTVFTIEFIQNKIRYYYDVELNERAIVREELYFYSPNRAKVFSRTTDLDKQLSKISFGNKITIDKVFEKTLEANTLWNNTVLSGFLKTNIELKELKDATDWFDNYLHPLIYSRTDLSDYITSRIDESKIKKDVIIRILQKADFNISNLSIDEITAEPNGKRNMASVKLELEHTIHREKYNLPFDVESQGTQRYYGLAGILYLLSKDSTAFPIDELESSLHPDLFAHFLLLFLINTRNSQLIATVHNREILNNRDIFRNDAIWITDKCEDASTGLYSLTDFDTSVIRDTSNIYNAYKIGKLGGIPNLGDYYIDIE
jgi:AAA15 family ATPase/GTPase